MNDAVDNPDAGRLIGNLDTVSRDRIAGWAWQSGAPVILEVLDGEARLGCVTANQPRADVRAAGIANGFCGFELHPQPPLDPGRTHSITVRRLSDGCALHGSPRLLAAAAAQPPPAAPPIVGGEAGLLAGTRLHAAGGLVPVEALLEGELLVARSGAMVRVVALTRKRFGKTGHPRPNDIRPVRIRGGALGPGQPARDVVVAPGQPVQVQGMQVPAGLLVNGVSILREPIPDGLAWFQVTLDGADMLPGEGIELAAHGVSLPFVTGGAALARILAALPDHGSAPAPSPTARLIVFIAGEPHTPGHVYRVVRAAAAARALGHHASWLPLGAVAERQGEIAAADTVIVWRAPPTAELDAAIQAARAGGARLLLDLDDLMVDPRLARPDIIDAIRQNDYDAAEVAAQYEGIRRMAKAADGCLCPTVELAVHLRELDRPAWVLPNGFDAQTLRRARLAVRRRQQAGADGLIRIGYAGGSRTHQRDLRPAMEALARLLHDRPECRLVLFREAGGGLPQVDVAEFPGLAAVAAQIEWRDMVPVEAVPDELARFDINLAPLEVGNPFCEAKSELKFFEAALVDVCTIASPTGPYRRAIRPGETGFLAESAAEWHALLRQLIDDAPARRRVARAAYLDVLWTHGPEHRADVLGGVLDQLHGGRAAGRAFEIMLRRAAAVPPPTRLPEGEIVHSSDRMGEAEVTIIIPLYNYAAHIREALDSVWHQDLALLDLVVVDDRSTDESLEITLDWIRRNGHRFNRVVVWRNLVNSGLGLSRNAGFAAAETPYILPLDADNRIMPDCARRCLDAIGCGGAFAYPRIRQFGQVSQVVGGEAWFAMRLAGGNYIDAMALVAKPAWAAVGGYDHVRFGWEDYDFWCRLAERGFWGQPIDAVLAEYRVHEGSMLRTTTDVAGNKRKLVDDLQRRHDWLTVKPLMAAAAQKQRLTRRPASKRSIPASRVNTVEGP